MPETDRAVILARGLGTRMRKPGKNTLSRQQEEIAGKGIKALISIDRPFLDYVLSALADAGYRRICLVIGPEHEELRRYYGEELHPERVEISFAIQEEPLGTADAVLAAEGWTAGEPFLAINSDNYYPVDALLALRDLPGCALAAFSQEAMLRASNIDAARILKFAVIRVEEDGSLREVFEKPDALTLDSLPQPILISMNCWRFTQEIFDACRAIEKSSRGEYEITDAVAYAMQKLGVPFLAVPIESAVLDLSSRDDIASVTQHLKGIQANP